MSWIAAGGNHLIYLLHRGPDVDPVVVLNERGNVVRSFGKGALTLPHSLRLDREGNIWTTDAASSRVTKFSPAGETLLAIEVGGQPEDCVSNPKRRGFCGVTDVAFGPGGEILVADGYANSRVVEFTPDGRRVREWGTRGSGPGEFNLPHSIVIDDRGIIYVADRENQRVQLFDLRGQWLGEWRTEGNPYTLALDSNIVWIDVLRPMEPGASRRRGQMLEVERSSGRILGSVDVPGGHGTAVTPDGRALLVPGGEKIHRVGIANPPTPRR